ncbi:hypothetical protein JHC09_11100 [Devosia sp. MC532]|uniref:hypothetical protein n=1 Tax=Devosia sp. MC532 TaxID=2799788 RepID=UPI0018F4125F|nr:hypothetical protein [Devosia sp. MC532]MBJ7578428.1 hypothetical protein [Devosia sp. MC532]
MRKMFAGPVFEQEMLGKRRDWSELPPGVVYESTYNEMTALAAEQNNGTSLLLRGSEIALTACSKSPAAISFLRAYGNYSGILEKAEDGRSYIVMRDLVFKSHRQLAQFFSGRSNISKLEWTRLSTPAEELEAPVR